MRAGVPHRIGRLRLATAALATAALASTALLLTGCSTPPSAGRTARPHTAGSEPTAAVIGDSIAVGWNVPAQDAWPLIAANRLGWDMTDFAEGGAGFTTPGVNTHDFDDQVSAVIRLRPQVVVIAATRNDAPTATASPETVRTAMRAAVDRLSHALPHTTIVGMGAVWGATPTPAVAPVLDEALESAVAAVGGHWLDLGQTFLGRPELLQTDGIHPNSRGQALLGSTVADAIEKARIEPGRASG